MAVTPFQLTEPFLMDGFNSRISEINTMFNGLGNEYMWEKRDSTGIVGYVNSPDPNAYPPAEPDGYTYTPIGQIGAGLLRMDLLWENASPASSFALQTVAVDLSGYAMIAVETYTPEQGYSPWGLASGGYKMDVFHVRNDTTYLLDLWGFMRSGNHRTVCYASRNFTINVNGVAFKDAYGNTARSESSPISNIDPQASANGFLIPTRIFGIKGVSV